MKRQPVLILAALLVVSSGLTHAQDAAKPVAQSFAGCVGRIQNTSDKYVLATGDRCMLLAGTYDASRIADHEVTARGILVEAAGMAPLTLNIQTVQSVKAACTRTCVLDPPGTRGIHGKERPGKEGGTPGMKSTPGTAPQD